jgi:hypothetical protein
MPDTKDAALTTEKTDSKDLQATELPTKKTRRSKAAFEPATAQGLYFDPGLLIPVTKGDRTFTVQGFEPTGVSIPERV